MRNFLKSVICSLLLMATSVLASNQYLTLGDGEFSWEVTKKYSLAGVPVGIEHNTITWSSDAVGNPRWMTIHQIVTSETGAVLYDDLTEFVPAGGGITWGVNMESPWAFFWGLYDESEVTSVLTWSNHTGTSVKTISVIDPESNSYLIWCDWVKERKRIVPRITFGSEPRRFDSLLSNGQNR